MFYSVALVAVAQLQWVPTTCASRAPQHPLGRRSAKPAGVSLQLPLAVRFEAAVCVSRCSPLSVSHPSSLSCVHQSVCTASCVCVPTRSLQVGLSGPLS